MAAVLTDHAAPQTREVFGIYEAVKGKLSQDDAREAYVRGPDLYGRIAPLASFWRWEEAKAWAKHCDHIEAVLVSAGLRPRLILPESARGDETLRNRLIQEWQEEKSEALLAAGVGDW